MIIEIYEDVIIKIVTHGVSCDTNSKSKNTG
jgi:hypothetical protein